MSRDVLNRQVQVINIGIERFSEDLKEAGVPVIQVDWRPPAGGNRKIIEMLDILAAESSSACSD